MGDGLTSSQRDAFGLWTIAGSLARWYGGVSLDVLAGTRVDSAAGLSAFLETDASDHEKLLASQIGRLAWRFDASRYDGDFGDFPAAWENPALEMDASTVMDEAPVWRDPEVWQAKPIAHAEVIANHRKAVAASLALTRREIALAEEYLDFLAADPGTFAGSDPGRGWKAYEAAGGPDLPEFLGGKLAQEGFVAPADAATARRAREGMLLKAGLPEGEAGIAVLAERARHALRFKRAEEIFLAWLLESEDPVALLSECSFRRVRPWRALIEAAGYGDVLPGRRVKADAAEAVPVSEAHLEDLVARFLAPDGGALLNRFERAAYWMEGAKARFDEVRALIAAGGDVSRFRPPPAPSIHTAIRRAGTVAPATVRAAEVDALRDCVPALGSASHPDFEIPLGSVIVAVPGEPAYLRGDGWCVSPRGNLWFDDHPGSDRSQWVPFIENEQGPRIAFYRGKRWICDADLHRDECVGERFWRVKRLQALQFDALRSDVKFGSPEWQAAFAPGRHPLDRGMTPDSTYVDRLWLSAWPWRNRMPPPSVMFGATDLAGWRPNPMMFFEEQAGIWNPGPSRGRRAMMDIADAMPKVYRPNDWSRVSQNRGRMIRRMAAMSLRWEDLEEFDFLCAAAGMRPQGMPEGDDLALYFAERGYGKRVFEEADPAHADKERFLARLGASVAQAREAARSRPEYAAWIGRLDEALAKWDAACFDPVGEDLARRLGAQPGDSRLTARALVHGEMKVERDRHAEAMRASGAMLVHVPLDGSAPIAMPWSGEFRPLGHDIAAEVAALEGAWTSRACSAEPIPVPAKEPEYGGRAFFEANKIPYDSAATGFAHMLYMRVKGYDRAGLAPDQVKQLEIHDGVLR